MKNNNLFPDFYPNKLGEEPPKSNDYTAIEKLANNEAKYSYYLPVSIVIPFYQGHDFLDKSLASLCHQSYPPHLVEIIISEDGAPIDSSSLVEKYKSKLNISRITQERCGYRLATARNNGIVHATSGIIIIIDFDIVTSPFFIESHMKWFHTSTKVATFGLRRFVDLNLVDSDNIMSVFDRLEELKPVASVSNRLQQFDKRMNELHYIKTHPFPCNLFHGCNIAFTKQRAINIGLFDEAFNGNSNYEDLEFGYRLYQSGCFIVYEPNAFVLHQENEIVNYQKRLDGMRTNKELVYQKIPGFRQFRATIGQE